MNRIILLFVFIFCNLIYPQQIKIFIKNINSNKALLYSFQGEETYLIDSIKVKEKDKFIFFLDSKKYHSGFYRLFINENKWVDFIYDGEEINIVTCNRNLLDSLKIISSESNRLYYSFIKLNKLYKTKTELLHLILTSYPKDDDYYKRTQDKAITLQKEYLSFISDVVKLQPSSFIARYITSAQLPVTDLNIAFDKQLAYLKKHSLDNVDFNDDGLIYSDAFTNKTIEYLTSYRNPQLPKEMLEKEFMIAVDTVLNKAKVNEIVYQHIVEYLIDGFKKFGFDTVLDYIVENYVIKDDLCLDVKTEGLIKKRIDQAKYLHVDNVVPDIILPDSTGKMIELNKVKSEKILVIFYASWCPHCQTLLPQIRDLYNKQVSKRFEVLAVSLDTSKTDWLNFVNNNSLNWINVCDMKGWDGKAAIDYFLYATPTIFMVNDKKEIIEKPVNINELQRYLSE